MPCGSPLVSEMSSVARPKTAAAGHRLMAQAQATTAQHDGGDLEPVVDARLRQRRAEAGEGGGPHLPRGVEVERPRLKYSRWTVSNILPNGRRRPREVGQQRRK